MFNGYVLYLQAVTTPNPFVKLPKLPFHKSLLLIFCLRLRFPFSFFKLFFAAAACFSGGSGYFPTAALVIFPGRLWLFPRGGFGFFPVLALFFLRLWLFSRGGSGYFPRRLWLFSQGGSGYFPGAALVIFQPR